MLITLDTTRRDHLGCYGIKPSPTPQLDALAEQSVVFDDAWTVTPFTLPAHASLLTGLYPFSHGVRENSSLKLADSAETLAERLRADGYSTAAHVAAYVLDAGFGLAQGFDVYEAPRARPGEATLLIPERSGASVVDEALQSLHALPHPRFVWVHLFDPHFPYSAPDSKTPLPNSRNPHAQDRYRRQAYREEIKYADSQVGRLLQELRASGDWERTIVVVTADHGEGLGDDGEPTHGYFLNDATTRIPLILHDARLAPRRVSEPVSIVDVFPTLMDRLGLKPSSRIDGEAWVADQPNRTRTLSLEAYNAYLQHGWAPFEGVVDARWKWVHSRSDRLFDRSEPARPDVLAQNLEVASRLHAQNERMRAQRAANFDAAFNPDADSALLEALGYVQSGKRRSAADRPELSTLVDPYQNLGVLKRLDDVTTALAENRFVDAVGLLEGLCRDLPEGARVRQDFADQLLLHFPARLDDAERALEAVLGLQPAQPRDWFNLALIAQRRMKAAQEPPQGAAPEPSAALLHRHEAIRRYRACLELNASHSKALFNLAGLLEAEYALAADPNAARALVEEMLDLYKRFLAIANADEPARKAAEHRIERLQGR